MEFLGVERKQGLALRIADVPSGRDNVIGKQRRHIRTPEAHHLKFWADGETAHTEDTEKVSGSTPPHHHLSVLKRLDRHLRV